MRALGIRVCTLALIAFASCDGSPDTPLDSARKTADQKPTQDSADALKEFFPKSDNVRPGKRYPFRLGSCWLPDWIDFDHHYWGLVGELRPDRFRFQESIPFTIKGSIRLLSEKRAVFWQGQEEASLKRAPEPHLSVSDNCF